MNCIGITRTGVPNVVDEYETLTIVLFCNTLILEQSVCHWLKTSKVLSWKKI